MNNFKSSVPESVQTKLKELAELIESDFSDIVSNRGAYSCLKLSEIEGNYVSGWMPRQDGGFEVSEFFQCDQDSSYHFSEKQTEYMQEQAKTCYDSFLADNDLDADTEYSDLTDEQQNDLSNYESGWMDAALLQVQMYAYGFPGSYWGEEEQTINIRVSINYKDAPHYREGSAEDIKQVILSVDEFLATPNEEIIKQLVI